MEAWRKTVLIMSGRSVMVAHQAFNLLSGGSNPPGPTNLRPSTAELPIKSQPPKPEV